MMSLARRRVLQSLLRGGLALGSCAVLPLTACDTPPTRRGFPDLTYQHLPKLRFDVREIEVVETYRSSGEPPHVEDRMPVPPARAAANWGRNRLQAAGSSRRLRYIVRDASVVEVPLAIEEGLSGAFRVEQSERYEARVEVEVQIVGGNGVQQGSATAEAQRSVTVAEDITLNDRERVWFRLVESLMKDLDGQLETTLRTVFAQDMLP